MQLNSQPWAILNEIHICLAKSLNPWALTSSYPSCFVSTREIPWIERLPSATGPCMVPASRAKTCEVYHGALHDARPRAKTRWHGALHGARPRAKPRCHEALLGVVPRAKPRCHEALLGAREPGQGGTRPLLVPSREPSQGATGPCLVPTSQAKVATSFFAIIMWTPLQPLTVWVILRSPARLHSV